LTYTVKCEKCGSSSEIVLEYFNLRVKPFGELANKYLIKEAGAFMVNTRSYGILKIQPSNIYRATLYKDFITSENRRNSQVDVLFAKLYWLFLNDDNQFEKDAMENAYAEYMDVKNDPKKLSLYMKLMEELSCVVLDEIEFTCASEKCGVLGVTPIQFPNGLENLFLYTDIDSELL
jgi:hypothetical protein